MGEICYHSLLEFFSLVFCRSSWSLWEVATQDVPPVDAMRLSWGNYEPSKDDADPSESGVSDYLIFAAALL